MSNTIAYIQNYIGPVFFVDKKTVEYSTINRNIESCPNIECEKHQQPVSGLPLHCTECGSKIQMVLCERNIEKTPSFYTENFYGMCASISNSHVNGTSYFMDPSVKLFNSDNELAYVPKLRDSELKFALIDNKTIGTYCENEKCKLKHRYTNSEYKHCPECGEKTFVNITHSITLPLNEDEAIFEQSINVNYDNFQLIQNSDWQKLVIDYAETENCKKLINIIEKAYGKDSVIVKLAFVSYHTHH